MTIYLDVIFIENICMNYIILFATGIINKVKVKHRKLLFSSIIGSIYAVVSYMQMSAVFGNIIVKILLSIVMIYIAFIPKKPKQLFKILIIFYLTSFAFGGCAFALLYFVKPEEIFMKNGVYIGTYPIKIALLGGIVGFIVIVNAFKIVKGKISKKDMFCEIKIIFEEKVQKVIAMIDTGNMLKDPITRLPVVVVEKDSLKEVLPEEILDNVDKIVSGNYEKIIGELEVQKYISRFRVIPFSSLGKQNGLLLGFKADSVCVLYDENEIYFNNIIIGIYDKELSKNNAYQALIGIDMLGKEEKINECVRNIKVKY